MSGSSWGSCCCAGLFGPPKGKKAAEADKQRHIIENRAYSQRLRFVTKVPLFRRIPKDQGPLLASACVDVCFAAGDAVIFEGQIGEELFVIYEGEAEVCTVASSSQSLAVLEAGDYFGERALLLDEPHAATVTARTRLRCYRLQRQRFEELGLGRHVHVAQRRAVAFEGGQDSIPMARSPSTQKSESERVFVREALQRNEHLRHLFGELAADRVERVVDLCWRQSVELGEELLTAGDSNADYFYMVQSGEFQIRKDLSPEVATDDAAERFRSSCSSLSSPCEIESPVSRPSEEDARRTPTSATGPVRVGPGECFGELALLLDDGPPRSATVKALSKAVVWALDRKSFRGILMERSDARVAEYENIIMQADILSTLYGAERRNVAEALVEMHFVRGEVVLREGERGRFFYVLYDGEVAVSKGGQQIRTMEASSALKKTHIFGERALLDDAPRSATVEVTSLEAKLLALDKSSFDVLLGPVRDIMSSQRKRTRMGSEFSMKSVPSLCPPAAALPQGILKEALQKVGLLGCGGFGTVELVVNTTTGKTYALKAMSKGFIVKKNMQERILNEKWVLQMTDSHFIIRLHACYMDSQYLYLLLEPALGGELHATYKREKLYGSIPHAAFYTASVALAFEHLHQRHILYRDLKPENLLLTADGNLKLTDMGLARFCVGKAFSTVGTPEYFAPEIISCSGHTKALDWWTFGILLYELMTKNSPFNAKGSMNIFKRIMAGTRDSAFVWPADASAKALIKELLQEVPSHRLPVRQDGLERLRGHAWFKDIDWGALAARCSEVPYRPCVHHSKDLHNFRVKREHLPKPVPYEDDGSGWEDDWVA